ncbi:MAG: DUF4366 domain-containing protein [Oscillospiraceae bacterium]|nr:DUF4366 domain-containing protein [Oscillospiraceae bacterium]
MKKISKFFTSAAALCLIAGISPALAASAEETTETPSTTSVVSSETTMLVSTLPVASGNEPAVITGDSSTITPEDVENPKGSVELTLPSGNGILLEDVLDEDVDRQFLTIQSKNGNTFYIVIDKDDTGHNNVYFMNLVDEYDLLAFADNFPADDKNGSKKKAETASSKNKNDTSPETQEDPEPDEEPSEQPVKPSVSRTSLLLPAGIILALVGSAAFYFFKIKGSASNNSKKRGFDDDEDDFDDVDTVNEDE